MSQLIVDIISPSSNSDLATASWAESTSAITTVAPSLLKRFAVARPMPLAAPVTNATLFASFILDLRSNFMARNYKTNFAVQRLEEKCIEDEVSETRPTPAGHVVA